MSEKQMMKAVVCEAFGPPENLVVKDIERPQLQDGQALVRVEAVAATFPDVLMLEDKYQFKAPLPYVPGSEVAGVIVEMAGEYEGLSVGARVLSPTLSEVSGAFAEYAVVNMMHCRIVPDHVAFDAITGLGYSYGTTYYGLKYRAQLKEKETVLVLGAGGHLGITAIEIAKIMGAEVIAAASSEQKLELCRQAGADHTINYATEDLKNRAKELSGGGVDVIFDPVGGDYCEQALRASAWGGRHLVIGFTAGIPKVPLNLLLLKGCSLVGVFYGAMRFAEPVLHDEVISDLIGFISSGELAPNVVERFSLEEAPAALRLMMDRKARGKVVITPSV